jgi:hypothetical protein
MERRLERCKWLSQEAILAISPEHWGAGVAGALILSVPFRMVGGEVTLSTANPKLDVKVSLHPAFQCMVT